MKEEEVEYKAGDTVFTEGEAGTAVFSVVRGTIELYKNGQVILDCRTGDFFGEIEVMDNSTRVMTAIAKTSVLLKRFTRNEFLNLLKKDGDVSIAVIKGISRKTKILDNLPPAPAPSAFAQTIKNTFKSLSASKALIPFSSESKTRKDPVPAGKKPSLFNLLFKKEADDLPANAPLIIMPSIKGDDENRYQNNIASILKELHGVRVKTYSQPMPETDVLHAFDRGDGWLRDKGANLVVWLERERNADAINIHFIPRDTEHDNPGEFTYHCYLRLPTAIEGNHKALLKAITAAALPALSYEQSKLLKILVPTLLQEVSEPSDAKSNLLCYGNLLACMGNFEPKSNYYKQAEDTYNKFIDQTDEKEKVYAAAALYQIGLINQSKGEFLNDIGTLYKSAQSFDEAIQHITRTDNPAEWGLFYLKLGNVLHKIAVLEEKIEVFEQAMTAYKNALEVYSKTFFPLRCAETLNSLGLTTHVLAEHLQSLDLAKHAVKLYTSALEMGTRELSPLLWATTKNNMASALFLLGRMTGETDYYFDSIAGFKDALEIYEKANLYKLSMVTTKNLKRTEEELIKLGGRPELAATTQIPMPEI